MNDLIAVDGTEAAHQFFASVEDPTEMLGYVPIIGDCYSTAQAFGEGDWAAGLKAFNTIAGAVTTGMEAASDPIGFLLSSCAAFLIDYMPPLPQMLDALAGNPALVQSIGETWGNVSGALTERAGQLEAQLAQMMSSWQGAAADAFRARMEFLIGMTKALAAGAMGIGSGFAVASVIVEFVRTQVRDLIADLVGKLISYVIETGATLGVALPVVIGQASIAIASKVTDVMKWSESLIDAITSGLEILEQLIDIIRDIQDAIAQVQGQPA